MKQKMYQKFLKERGITLIALVITIIVLLILAGVTINIAVNSGIMDKSEKAVNEYLLQEDKEANRLEELDYTLTTYFGLGVDNTEGTENITVNGEDFAYNNPVIPVGFKTSSDGANWASIDGTTVQGWNEGLVIEDENGNQFVWVPVDGSNVTYNKWLGAKNASDITSLDVLSDDDIPIKVTSEWSQNEQSQITKYGGFYIARYEAGIPESMTEAISTASVDARNVSGTPVSQKNQVPWNFIDYNNSKSNAESMYSTEYVQSGLITGTMWDTTMKWLENSGVNVQTDSTAWGNCKDVEVIGITEYSTDYGASWTSASTKPSKSEYILKTGNSDYTKKKNIYDLAGNLYEITNELCSSEFVGRGSCFWNDKVCGAYRWHDSLTIIPRGRRFPSRTLYKIKLCKQAYANVVQNINR